MAKENQKESGGAVPQKSAKPVETRKELAKLAGLSVKPTPELSKILTLETGCPLNGHLNCRDCRL